MAEQVKEKEKLHYKMLADLTEQYSSDMENYDTFLLRVREYISPVSIKASKHVADIFDALEKKGHLTIGKYDVLKQLFEGIEEPVVTLIKRYEDIMKAIEGMKEEEKASSINIVDIWKDISALIMFQIRTKKLSTTNALQRYIADELKNILIYPEVHAVWQCCVDKKSVIVRAASPLFYKACCSQEKINTILHKILDNPIQIITWLKAELATDLEIAYKKENLTTKTEKSDKMANEFCDCRQWVEKEVFFDDISEFLTQNNVIDVDTLKTVTDIDELIEFLLKNPEKHDNFKSALNAAGYRGIVEIWNGSNVDDLISCKAYKVYISILKNYNSIRELNIRVLEDCSLRLKRISESLPLKDMNLLLKEILSNVNALHAFILALNNASYDPRCAQVLDRLTKETTSKKEEDTCTLELNIKEGVLKKIKLDTISFPREDKPSNLTLSLGDDYEMRIREKYSCLLKFSIVSIREELVSYGIIPLLTKYLIENEVKNDIKMDMVIKLLLRTDRQKFEFFLSILRKGKDKHKEMACILEKGNNRSLEDTESQTTNVDDLKASLRKSLDNTTSLMDYMETNFLHPFFEEKIISIDEHDQVFYDSVESKHKHMTELIVSKIDRACQKQKWIKKYEALAIEASNETAPFVATDRRRSCVVQITEPIVEETLSDYEASSSGGEILLTVPGEQCPELYATADTSLNILQKNVSDLHGVIDKVEPGSIKVTLKSPSLLFYNKFKYACESGGVQSILQMLIQEYMKDDFSSSSSTAEVEIKLTHKAEDYKKKVPVSSATSTLSKHKLRNCRNIIASEVFLSDIEQSLQDYCVIDHTTLTRIMYSKNKNRTKMEEVIGYIEEQPVDIFQKFITAIESSGYMGIADILNGSYAKYLNALPDAIVRMCILDNYRTFVDEIKIEELKTVSVQLIEDIERIQRQTQNKKNVMHLFLKEILLDNEVLLDVFIDSLSNHTKYHHMLKKLEDTSLLYQELEELAHDACYTYKAKIQITNTAVTTDIEQASIEAKHQAAMTEMSQPRSETISNAVPTDTKTQPNSGAISQTFTSSITKPTSGTTRQRITITKPQQSSGITSQVIKSSTAQPSSGSTYYQPFRTSTAESMLHKIPQIATTSTTFLHSGSTSQDGKTNSPIGLCSGEHKQYLRFSALILKTGACALRSCFDSKIQPKMLQHELSILRNKLFRLKSKGIVNADQWDTLYPPMGGKASSKEFGITLMSLLLREISGMSIPVNGWDIMPESSDVSVGADIVRLRMYSNEIASNSDEALSNKDFLAKSIDIRQAITRLAQLEGQNLGAEIDRILNSAIDETDLDLWREVRMELQQMKKVITVKLESQEISPGKLKSWTQDGKTFFPTKATELIYDEVKSKRYCISVGLPGAGKTANIHHIALRLKNEGHRLCCVQTFKELISKMDSFKENEKQVYIIDDVFGVHGVDETKRKEWCDDNKDDLERCLNNKNVSILCSSRKQVIDDHKLSNIKSRFTIVNISEGKAVLSGDERAGIFEKHAITKQRSNLLTENKDQLKPEIKEKVGEIKCPVGCFPLVCHLYTGEEEPKQTIEKYFNKPLNVIADHLKKLEVEDSLSHLCLLLCLIYDNKLSVNIITVGVESDVTKNKRHELLELCELPVTTSRQTIQKKMDTLLQTFIKREDDTYKFVHDIIHDAVLKHTSDLSSSVHQVIMSHCSAEFMRYRVHLSGVVCNWPWGGGHDTESCINIRHDSFTCWGDRWLDIVRDGVRTSDQLYNDIDEGRCSIRDRRVKYDNPWLDVFWYNRCVRSTEGQTAIVQALDRKSQSDVQTLMCTDGYSLYGYKYRHTALHWSIMYGLTHIVRQTLSMISTTRLRQLDSTDKYGWGLLTWAERSDNTDMKQIVRQKLQEGQEDSD